MKHITTLLAMLIIAGLISCSGMDDNNNAGDIDLDGSTVDGDIISAADEDEDVIVSDGDSNEIENSDDDFEIPENNEPFDLPSGTAPVQHSGYIISTIPEALAALDQEPELIRLNFRVPVGAASSIRIFREKAEIPTSGIEWLDAGKSIQVLPENDGGVGTYEVLYEITTSNGYDAGYFVFYVEQRESGGTAIDSILAFRENSISGAQYTSLEDYELQIDGLVETPKDWAYQDLLSRPSSKRLHTLNCVEGWAASVLWEGVSLKDLLAESNPDSDASTIIFHALDEYTSSVSMEYIQENDILLAYKMNGMTLPAMRGFPFEVVAVDKWGYKWVKWVNRIELSNNDWYRGFWEGYGYNNDGSLDGPILEGMKSGFSPALSCGDL